MQGSVLSKRYRYQTTFCNVWFFCKNEACANCTGWNATTVFRLQTVWQLYRLIHLYQLILFTQGLTPEIFGKKYWELAELEKNFFCFVFCYWVFQKKMFLFFPNENQRAFHMRYHLFLHRILEKTWSELIRTWLYGLLL